MAATLISKKYEYGTLELQADWTRMESNISYRTETGGDNDDFKGTPFQVAQFTSKSESETCDAINEWLDSQFG